MTLTFDIPLPPKACSGNSRAHWRKKAAHVKAYRDACYLLAFVAKRECGWTGDKPVRIETEWFMGPTVEPRYRPLDSTNGQIALKAAIDGIADARIVPKDTHKWVSLMPPVFHRHKKEHKGMAKIVVTITQENETK